MRGVKQGITVAWAYGKLPRAHQLLIERRIKTTAPTTIPLLRGDSLRNWREAEPKIPRRVLAAGLGVSNSLVAHVEECRASPNSIFGSRLQELYDLVNLDMRGEPVLVEKPVLLPEVELSQWMETWRSLINKYRPLIGSKLITKEASDLLSGIDTVMTQFQRPVLCLGRTAHDRAQSASAGQTST